MLIAKFDRNVSDRIANRFQRFFFPVAPGEDNTTTTAKDFSSGEIAGQ